MGVDITEFSVYLATIVAQLDLASCERSTVQYINRGLIGQILANNLNIYNMLLSQFRSAAS